MENIISIKGKVKHKITLDPGVWIFDDRRVDLNTCFESEAPAENKLDNYTKAISKHWDREIMEGSVYPPTLKSEKKFEKEKLLTGTFGIPFKPFLENAAPEEHARALIIESASGETEIPIAEAKELIFGFSREGKPLNEDGPIHIYYGDGSNKNNPIKNVKSFRIV